MRIFWIDLEITWLANSWRVNRLDFLKSVAGVFSNHGAMMAEIMWQRRLVSCWFGWSRILGCRRGLEIWIGDSSVPPTPFINGVKSSGWKSHLFFLQKNPCLKIIPIRCYVFLLHQVKKEKGEDGDRGNIRQAFAVWELASMICQSLWLARHEISIIMIGRHC